jgi:ATP-dependent DNA helicase PIF1
MISDCKESVQSITQEAGVINESPRKRKRHHEPASKDVVLLDSEPPTPEKSPRKPTKVEYGTPGQSSNVIVLLDSDDEGPPWDPICKTNTHPNIKKGRRGAQTKSTSDVLNTMEQEPESDQIHLKADVVPITEPELCKEQADLVDLIVSGKNVFYTGSAGSGKSTVLKAFCKRLREKGLQVDIVAPTGRAALDINGSTTWTYAGWTPNHHARPLKDLKIAAHGKFVRRRLKATHVLVLDEISMVENLHLERLNEVMKEARNSELAFGGVQVSRQICTTTAPHSI